jgi:Tfp pilus assembly protein PilF
LYYFLIFKESVAFAGRLRFLAPGWLLVSLGWYLSRKTVLAGSMPLKISDMIRSLFDLPAVVLYVGKMLLPVNLSVLPILQDSSLIYGVVTLAIVFVLFIFTKNRRYGFILFGVSWVVLFLLPSLVFSDPSRFIGVALYEHRVYLPLIGFIILLMETDLIRNNIDIKKKGLVLGVLIIIAFSAMTFIHCRDFKNRLNFWESAVRTSPHHPLAHRNLGAMYYLEGNVDKAEPEYRKALELNPYEPMAHNNLGLIYMNKNRFKEAEQEFIKELKINPFYDNAYFNYGLLCARQGRWGQAAALWKRTLEINPDHIYAYNYLAVYYYGQKEYALAKYYVLEAQKRGVQIDPEFLKALNLRR